MIQTWVVILYNIFNLVNNDAHDGKIFLRRLLGDQDALQQTSLSGIGREDDRLNAEWSLIILDFEPLATETALGIGYV